MDMNIIIYPVAAFLLSLFINIFLLKYLRKKNVLDIPNERSSHKIPTPRGGGRGIMIAIALSTGVYCLIAGEEPFLWILCFSIVMGIMGWIDDVKKGLSTRLRFLVQIAAAIILMLIFGPIDTLPFPKPLHIHLGYFGYVFGVIWLVGITNIFNFLDGIDGYAGTQGLIAGVGIAILSWHTTLAVTGLIIAAACLGFLFINWHPAKIFMGDVGSSFLGFLFAALPFYVPGTGEHRESFFFAIGVLLWFFLTDGSFTMIRRLIKGEKIWEAHRSHLYQRMVIAGYSHSKVVIIVSMMYAILIGFMFYLNNITGSIIHWKTLMLGVALFIIYIIWTMRAERMSKAK